LICSECGNYQPDRAKFCGICGAALSQEGLMESFLKDHGNTEIVLPRHRSFLFYLAVSGVVILALAIFTGAGWLVYKAGWSESPTKKVSRNGANDNTLEYTNSDIGFKFSYLDNWRLQEGYPVNDQLLSLKLSLSSEKTLELTGYQLDPIVTIGGLEAIKEYLAEDASKREKALGGTSSAGSTSDSSDSSASNSDTTGEEASTSPFISNQLNGLPVFYFDFNANVMGEATSFILYYVVADDYYFLFEGRSPQSEYKDVRSQIMAMAGSFKWVRAETTGDESTQPAGD
jgi:hypothetical protein